MFMTWARMADMLARYRDRASGERPELARRRADLSRLAAVAHRPAISAPAGLSSPWGPLLKTLARAKSSGCWATAPRISPIWPLSRAWDSFGAIGAVPPMV